MINNTELRELLVEKYDYKISQVDSAVNQINGFSHKVSAAFEKWLDTGEIDDTEVEGLTIHSILKARPMKTVAAYLTLSWLEKEPAQAKNFLKKREITHSAARRT